MAVPAVQWRGRSGRIYLLKPVRLVDFRLGEELLLLTLGSNLLWGGAAADVVDDAASRARFRLALDCADRAFAVDGVADGVSRMTVLWDLDGAEPVNALSAA